MILRKVDCDLVDACSSHELHFHSVSRYAVCRSSTRELNLFRDDSWCLLRECFPSRIFLYVTASSHGFSHHELFKLDSERAPAPA